MTRFLPLLAMLALLLAPFGMMSGAAAAAMPDHRAMAAMAAMSGGQGHCADGQDEDRSEGATIDCLISCAAIPAIAPPAAIAGAVAPKTVHHIGPARASLGTQPEADDPPPRFS